MPRARRRLLVETKRIGEEVRLSRGLALLLVLETAEKEIENAFGGRHAWKRNCADKRRDSHNHRAAPHALTSQLCTQGLLHPTQQTRRATNAPAGIHLSGGW
jgi:hypothetical protein